MSLRNERPQVQSIMSVLPEGLCGQVVVVAVRALVGPALDALTAHPACLPFLPGQFLFRLGDQQGREPDLAGGGAVGQALEEVHHDSLMWERICGAAYLQVPSQSLRSQRAIG